MPVVRRLSTWPAGNAKDPHTIVWKIEGRKLAHPAYLIGTCHAVDKSFLDSFPVVRQILGQADCLLTEIYPATGTDTSAGVMDIKALPLLNNEQYALLDSFFKATAGPAIGSRIQQRSTVIAVGYYHLAFKTGFVNLLRADGYTVTPVAI